MPVCDLPVYRSCKRNCTGPGPWISPVCWHRERSGLVPSCIACGKAVRGSVGFYAVSNLSITVSLSCRIVHICTATVIKAPIRPTIGNYHFPRFCHSVRGRVLFPWSPTCCHRPPEVFQRCMIRQYRRSRKVRGCEHGALIFPSSPTFESPRFPWIP